MLAAFSSRWMMLLRLAAFFLRSVLSLGFLAGPEGGMLLLGPEPLDDEASVRLKRPMPAGPQLEPGVLHSIRAGEEPEAPASDSASMSWSVPR